ncbi:hypothetical protein MMC16_007018 [Acarospora aff. strigata]|nr:hypothetical protein [Acarospora aff. strigata]
MLLPSPLQNPLLNPHSLSLFLPLFLLRFGQSISPPQHLSPAPSPSTTAPPTYPLNLPVLRRQGQGRSACPSGQVSCGNGCAYDCCDGQAGVNGWACRVSGEKCFTKGGPGGDSGLGDASFVTDSLASPRASGVSAAMSASASSGGLSKGDIAGITIGTVAVVSLIVFGIAFLALRKKKLEAGPRPTEPQAVTPADQPPVGDLRDHARPDIPTWPVEVDGDHEMRHWIPQELDGAETVRRREDGEVQEPKADATLVSPIQDDVDGVDHEHNKT